MPSTPSARNGDDGDSTEFVELELSPQLSQLYGISEGHDTQLKEGEFYVLRCHHSGYKSTVVQRENNILTLEEAQRHAKLSEQAMLDEMTQWHTLGAFQRMDPRLASNVIDARWVLKWKVVNGKRIIQARLVVRGFKDLQASSLSTFAGTTYRWGAAHSQQRCGAEAVGIVHCRCQPSIPSWLDLCRSCEAQGRGPSQRSILHAARQQQHPPAAPWLLGL